MHTNVNSESEDDAVDDGDNDACTKTDENVMKIHYSIWRR